MGRGLGWAGFGPEASLSHEAAKPWVGCWLPTTLLAGCAWNLGWALLAWQADFSDESYRHLRDIYPDLYDAVIARGRHQPIPLLQRAQAAAQGAARQATAPAQPQQPSTPSSPSSTTTVSTIKAAAPSAAVTQTAAGPGDQAAAPSAAVPSRTSTESPSRPSSYPPATAGRGRYHRGGRGHRRQGISLPVHRHRRRHPDAQDPELPSGLQLEAQPGAPALRHLRPVHP